MATSSIQAFGGSAMNGGVNINDFRSLSFVYPNEHVPFAVFNPANDHDDTTVTVPKPGKTFKFIDFEFTDNDLWDRISEAVSGGYLPVLRNGGYNYLPYDSEPSGRMVFATFYSVNVVSFVQVTDSNVITSETRGFDSTYSIQPTMSAQACVEYIKQNLAGIGVLMIDNSTGTIYRLVLHNVVSNVETWKFRTADGTGYDLVYDYTDPDNKVYTLMPITADSVWAHFVNESNWTAYNSSAGVNIDGAFTRPEGELVPLANPIHLEAGLYQFSLELARTNDTTANDVSNDDLTIRTGATVLRAMTFNFDCSYPYIQTRWCSGVFKMENAGDITFKIAWSTGGLFRNSHVKISHFFVNKL